MICGDAYKTLKKISEKSVNLCYLDPPFFSKRTYEKISKKGIVNSFEDNWDFKLEKYIEYMKQVLIECHRVLRDDGSLYLHCDWHACHYLKIQLDNIFGRSNFRNEIIWKRHNAHNDTKQGCKLLGRVHDVILFYSKTNQYKWNPMYQPYSEQYVKKFYKYVEPETGRLYAKGDLTGPGGRSKGNPRYKFLEVIRYWRYSKKRMYSLYRQGRIIQTAKGNVPLLKRYLDEMPGIILQDVWVDIFSVQWSNHKESVDYPTQKPLQLLERIIQISSNPKDLVLDPFCGSGSSLLAAVSLGRRYFGIDSNPRACALTRKRLGDRKIKQAKTLTLSILK